MLLVLPPHSHLQSVSRGTQCEMHYLPRDNTSPGIREEESPSTSPPLCSFLAHSLKNDLPFFYCEMAPLSRVPRLFLFVSIRTCCKLYAAPNQRQQSA